MLLLSNSPKQWHKTDKAGTIFFFGILTMYPKHYTSILFAKATMYCKTSLHSAVMSASTFHWMKVVSLVWRWTLIFHEMIDHIHQPPQFVSLNCCLPVFFETMKFGKDKPAGEETVRADGLWKSTSAHTNNEQVHMLPHKWCRAVMGQEAANVLPHVSYATGEEERRAIQHRNKMWWCTLVNLCIFEYSRKIYKSEDKISLVVS